MAADFCKDAFEGLLGRSASDAVAWSSPLDNPARCATLCGAGWPWRQEARLARRSMTRRSVSTRQRRLNFGLEAVDPRDGGADLMAYVFVVSQSFRRARPAGEESTLARCLKRKCSQRQLGMGKGQKQEFSKNSVWRSFASRSRAWTRNCEAVPGVVAFESGSRRRRDLDLSLGRCPRNRLAVPGCSAPLCSMRLNMCDRRRGPRRARGWSKIPVGLQSDELSGHRWQCG